MSGAVWEISPAEHQANMAQFASLNPQMGKIDGNTARTVLMKSNLPAAVLAQIWALSDMNRDGMLDEREFSIAMRLTRNSLAGASLPPSLPPSLHQLPSSFVTPPQPMGMSMPPAISSVGPSPLGNFGSPPAQPTFPVYNSAPAGGRSMSVSGVSSGSSPGKQCANWTIPHQVKLRYSQQFNQFDKQRLGFLNAQVGRSALGMTGLPTQLLAHVWSLADVNKDGRLSVDEFYIAMHMIDMHKAGFSLPDVTPPELVQMCGLSRSANNSPQLEPGAPPAQKTPAPKTFEDKRMDNFAKGQAELERRRQVLLEEENRRKAEQEKRDREEADKRERERLEKERRREAERQAELDRLRMMEEARMEEERRREAEREAARIEAEKHRMAELEKQRVKELQAQKQQEAERTAQRQQRQKTLGFQLQALDEKQTDTDNEITKSRERIKEITNEIEGMRGQRDEKMMRITDLQTANQQLSVQAQEIAHQLLQLQSANKELSTRRAEMEASERRRDLARSAVEGMRAQLEQLRQKTAAQRDIATSKRNPGVAKKQEVTAAREEYRRVLTLLAQLQIQARAKLAEKDAALAAELENQQRQAAAASATAANTFAPPSPAIHEHKTNGASSGLPSAASSGTTKYRALFEFVSRSEDELSFQPGDVILVFEGHNAEPGWRAGQIRDKIGWFPEAFAEPIAAVNPAISQPIQNMPPNVTPSPSLDRIPEEAAVKFSAAVDEAISTPSTTVICSCVAQFPWKARNDEDLSFAKGDLIEVIQQQDMKWRGRKADGSVGWFPKSYVKVQPASDESTAQSVEKATPPVASPTTPTSSRQASVVHQSSIHSAQQIPASVSSHSLSSAAPLAEWYVAMFEFDAAESTDLPLAIGDKILVLEKNDAWWKGRCNGREGIFPANYVQKSDEATVIPPPASLPVLCRVRAVADFDGSAANQLALRVGDEVAVREKSDAGWWEGETVRDGVTAAGWFPGDYVVAIEGSVPTSPGEVSATAQFDYTANQQDELSFKAGDVIIVESKVDAEWWSGHHPSNPSQKGLFPASYVQLSSAPSRYEAPPSLYELPPLEPAPVPSQLYDVPPSAELYQSALYDLPPVAPAPSKKFLQLSEELLTTEERYLGDLVLAKKLFYRNLLPVVDRQKLNTVFLNWEELMDVSKRILARLKRGDPAGQIFLSEIDALGAFVTFCTGQQSAVDAIPCLLSSSEARAIYTQCCASPHARGMSLNYFILIPLGRVTRYPLLLEKMLKESSPTNQEYSDLEAALQLLKALVSEVNRAVSEMDSLTFLYWAQQHVKCHGLQLEFTSPTRSLGSRQFLHSGVLYKSRSGRLLVAMLFNDFLLLTTPDESIAEPDSFKVNKSYDGKLSLYKQPLLIEKLRFSKEQDTNFILQYGEDSVHVRAATRNAAKMWSTQLQQATDNCSITMAEKIEQKKSNLGTPTGRLLIELLNLQHVSLRSFGSSPHTVTVSLGPQAESFETDAAKGDLHLHTQFAFNSFEQVFSVSIFQKKTYCPDIPVLEPASVPLRELIAESSRHRGPILKPLSLRKTPSAQKNSEHILVKFVVQLYESEI